MNSDTYSNNSYPLRYKVEERPTSPTLPHTSPHTLPILMIQKWPKVESPFSSFSSNCVVYCERGSPPPYIAWIGWLLASLGMETLATAFGRARESSPPKLDATGTHPGLAEPVVRLIPRGHLSHCLSSVTLSCGSSCGYMVFGGKFRRFSIWLVKGVFSLGPRLICFGMWALQFSCLHKMLWNILFPLFGHSFPLYVDTVSYKYSDSPKLMEMIRIKVITLVWCLFCHCSL
jgi:hypothetical protein